MALHPTYWWWRRRRRSLVSVDYAARVLDLDPIAYYKLNGDATDSSGNGYDGTAAGATLDGTGIGDGGTSGTFDGTGDYVDISAMAAAFSGAAGTLLVWGKTSVWTDATIRYMVRIAASGNHHVYIQKNSTDNTLLFLRKAGIANTKSVSDTSLAGSTDYFAAVLTWDTGADELKAYINGAQVGTTQTGLAAFVGTPSATGTVIGAADTGAANGWVGSLAHIAIWDRALDGSEISSLGVLAEEDGPAGDGIEQETGDYLLTEAGDYLLQE